MSALEIYKPQDEQYGLLNEALPYNNVVAAKLAGRRIDYSRARKRPLFLAALAANVGALLFGCSMGWSPSVQSQLMGNNISDADALGPWFIDLSDTQMSWVASLINAGALVGAMVGAALMDYFGRRGALMMATLPSSSGWILIALAQNPSMLYFGRFLCGVSGGITSIAAPSYIAEITTPKMRGPLGMLFSSSLCCGFLVSSLLGWLPWRWMCFVLTTTSFLIFGVMYMVPESPYFLLLKAQPRTEAETALQWLRGPFYDIQPEVDAIVARVRIDLAHAPHFDHLFLPWIYRPVFVSVALMVFQQVSGIGAVLFYSDQIFRLTGSTFDGLFGNLILAFILAGMALIAMIAVGRIGRRFLFLVSEGLCCFCLFMLGAYFYVYENNPTGAESIEWLCLLSVIIFVAAFAIGLGPLAWLITSEVLPSKFRGPGNTIANSVTWTIAFIITKTFVRTQESMGLSGPYWIFGCFSFLGFLFGLFVLPETKGRTPDEIQLYFEK